MVFNQRLGLVSSALFIWQFFSTVLFTSTALNLTSHDHLWLCCVRTSRDTSELQLCVLARPCGAIHCGWKPIPRGLTFGRTGLLFSAPCSWCLLNRKIQGQNRKDSRGDTMAWTLEKSIFCCCFSSRLYWNWAGGKTALLSELTAQLFRPAKPFVLGLPRRLSGTESACQYMRDRFDPWVEKIPWRRKWLPTPVFLPGKSHGERSLVVCSPWGCKRIGHDLDWTTKNYFMPWLWALAAWVASSALLPTPTSWGKLGKLFDHSSVSSFWKQRDWYQLHRVRIKWVNARRTCRSVSDTA